LSSSEPPRRITGNRPWRIVRRWPWLPASIAWVVVVGLVCAVRHHYTGIYGFSTANYGWLAFSLVGGAVLAWRLAGGPPAYQRVLRPLLAAAVAFVLCAVAVSLMGLVFLPSHPLQGGGATEGPLFGALHPLGRALPVAEGVLVVGYVAELVKPLWRLVASRARG
jgi:hypothetical protein